MWLRNVKHKRTLRDSSFFLSQPYFNMSICTSPENIIQVCTIYLYLVKFALTKTGVCQTAGGREDSVQLTNVLRRLLSFQKIIQVITHWWWGGAKTVILLPVTSSCNFGLLWDENTEKGVLIYIYIYLSPNKVLNWKTVNFHAFHALTFSSKCYICNIYIY